MTFSFFFSSRRRHTRLQGDWSSDVYSSDLEVLGADPRSRRGPGRAGGDVRGRAARDRVQRDLPARDPQVHADGRGPLHLQGPRAGGDGGAGRVERSGELYVPGDAPAPGRLRLSGRSTFSDSMAGSVTGGTVSSGSASSAGGV